MSAPTRGSATAGISWHWSFFLLGAVYALPAMVVIPSAPIAGLGLAVGVLPVAAFNLPGYRSGRRMILVVGALSAVCFVLGSLLTQVPALAVCALFVLAVAFAAWARAAMAGRVALAICLPLIGIGLSFHDVRAALVVAALVLGGALYAWGVAMLWPEHRVPVPVRDSEPTRGEMLLYGTLLGAAAATAAGIGYALELQHVGWATGAALLVMRPVRDQLVLRSIGRASSVLAGALAAASFALLTPQPWAIAIVVGLVIATLSATQASRWYIAPGFTSFIALTLILQGEDERPGLRFLERVVETGIGVGAALLFGAVAPAIIRAVRRKESPA